MKTVSPAGQHPGWADQGRERVVGDLSGLAALIAETRRLCWRWETDEADAGGPSSTRAPRRAASPVLRGKRESRSPSSLGLARCVPQVAAAAASRHEPLTLGRQVREFTVCLSPHHGADRYR